MADNRPISQPANGSSREATAPFPDGWPEVPSLTVTLDGKPVMSAPLMDGRHVFEVGPFRVWVTL